MSYLFATTNVTSPKQWCVTRQQTLQVCLSTSYKGNQSGAGPKITPVAYKIKRRKTIHANETNAYAAHWQGAFGNEEIRAGTHKSYWSCYIVQRMHPTTASFLGGLRIYKIVLLGEGGVGKSGEYELTIRAQSGVKISRPLTKGICEQTFKIDR